MRPKTGTPKRTTRPPRPENSKRGGVGFLGFVWPFRILRRFVAGSYVRACSCTVARTCLRNACGHLCCSMGRTMPMNMNGTRVRAARCHARGSAGALCRHGCRCNCAATCAEWKCRRATVLGPPCLAYLRRPNPPLRILMPGVRACSRRRACPRAWPLPNVEMRMAEADASRLRAQPKKAAGWCAPRFRCVRLALWGSAASPLKLCSLRPYQRPQTPRGAASAKQMMLGASGP